MAKITVNNTSFDVTKSNDNLLLDNKMANYDIISLPNGNFHMIMENKSYTISVLDKDTDKGTLSLLIDGRKIDTHLNNKLAELLKSMGMESGKKKLKNLKAPMPGLVLDILVQKGTEVSEGQELLVLEAMKMENAIKSPQDGVIADVLISKGDKVDKNHVLVSYE